VQLVVPLIVQLEAGQREWAFALDRLLGQPGWTKAERALMRELVCDGAAELLDADGEADPALKALFDKHSDTDFDTEQQQTRLAMKDMVEAMTGMDLGDDADIASDEELFKRLHEGIAAEIESERDPSNATHAAPKPRRKSPAQKQREADAQLATQSIREIFRKLASALHPDRETDPVQRAAKTALMQKVNQAYAANDLLTLLELQLQIEQVDASHIAGASAQRLKHYNKVLAEQLAELKHEVERVEAGFRIDFGLEMGWGLKPNKLIMFIDNNTRHLRAELATQQREMRMLEDKAATKRWLKRQQQRLRAGEFGSGFF
jgi:PIN domain nuclease of toxin-antitoxin system